MKGELAAAGITDSQLRDGYRLSRRLNARHGRTYFLATLLLPAAKRPYVNALYGFARWADDLVDDLDPTLDDDARAERFRTWSSDFLRSLENGRSDDPLVRAVIDTSRRWNIPAAHFRDFLDSMAQDLVTTEYETYADLERYMWGSAAVIGLEMLPILGRRDPQTPSSALEPYASALGQAFQLTNFIRDVGEDLDRGRIYLPQESLRRFGVDRTVLAQRRINQPIRDLLAFEIERTRAIYRQAEPGLDLVAATSEPCLRTAFVLYRQILDEIERADYDVFSTRAVVSQPRRLQVAGRGLVRAWLARRPGVRPRPTRTG
jgi:15-cis-phytoene synthase